MHQLNPTTSSRSRCPRKVRRSENLNGELIGRGIRVNAISPVPVTTPIYGKLGLPAEQLQGMAAQIQSQVPLGRFGDPMEIAKAVVFFASDESSFTVGSELVVGGGMSAV